MSIKNAGKWFACWAIIGAVITGGSCLTGCHSPSAKPQFADLSADGKTISPSAKPTPVATTAKPVSTSAAVPVAVKPVAAAATPPAPAPLTPARTNNPALSTDVLRVGDSLIVTFTDTPNIIPPFDQKIKEDGKITLVLNEEFKAEGKTPGELEKEIRKRYVPDYFKQMTVTIKYLESTRWYYVDGEVRSPNRQIYTSRITVSKAIASAGGFTDFANKKSVKLTRLDGRTSTINCVKALDNPTLDLEVYPGDKIYVKRRFW
jgi:polysaccharide biosynthesis/export protein VpsN